MRMKLMVDDLLFFPNGLGLVIDFGVKNHLTIETVLRCCWTIPVQCGAPKIAKLD
jgi:hypothetical protein